MNKMREYDPPKTTTENGKISGNADVRCISHNRVGITLITRHQYGNS